MNVLIAENAKIREMKNIAFLCKKKKKNKYRSFF